MFIYNLIIGPIERLVDMIFTVSYDLTGNAVISLLFLSVVISLFTLPFYNRADMFQEMEYNKRHSMEVWVNKIKKAFSGDEKVFMLHAYYKEQGYKPFYALRGTISLLLQIPFFIAAYHFLSNVDVFEGTKMGVPDAWLAVGDLRINVLPIVMTIVNLTSGFVYSNQMKWKEKWQIVGLPFVFLVILYNSPMGLVVYWIFNNVFSLIKNIVKKSCIKLSKNALKMVLRVLYIVGMLLSEVIFMYNFALAANDNIIMIVFFGVIVIITYNIPLFLYMKTVNLKISDSPSLGDILKKQFFCFSFVGLFIPARLIATAPIDFLDSDISELKKFVVDPALLSAGVFLVWFFIVWFLSNDSVKKVIDFVMGIVCIMIILNYFLWGGEMTIVEKTLIFNDGLEYSMKYMFMSIVFFAVVLIIVYLLSVKNRRFIANVALLLTIGAVLLTGYNYYSICREVNAYSEELAAQKTDGKSIFRLSRNGKNVIVFMVDRACGACVPYIFDERKELREQFSGFTFYPNTISTGKHTIFGAPGLFGGYDYSSEELNARTRKTNQEKIDEAMLVMPDLFASNDYKCTLTDLPLGDYSIYDGYDNIETHRYSNEYLKKCDNDKNVIEYGDRMFDFSLMRCFPAFAHTILYDDGSYLSSRPKTVYTDVLESCYSLLNDLSKLTHIEDGDDNFFVEYNNDIVHNPAILQLPNYEPVEQVDNDGYVQELSKDSNCDIDTYNKIKVERNYHVNMAAFIKIGQWIDFLKKEGIYDNTRIILVSDHGYPHGDFPEMILDEYVDVQGFNCLLMYKDFYSKCEFCVDNSFMTNEDVPTLAVKDLFDNPINRFTENAINSDRKKKGPIVVTSSTNCVYSEKEYAYDVSDAPWYSVKENIFDLSNWKRIS